MGKIKKNKQVEKLLFEIYDKGVKNQDCDLTTYTEKISKALNIHIVSVSFEQGYAKGWEEATSEAVKEINKNYRPNER